jgi:Fe-S-cluster containining protein
MAFVDSFDKVVNVYFTAFTTEPFTYKGKQYEPKTLQVSPSFFHSFNCFAKCGGCCSQFSLDYIPGEPMPTGDQAVDFYDRPIDFNGKTINLITKDVHREGKTVPGMPKQTRCDFLQLDTGYCGIHQKHPLTCDFAGLMVWNKADSAWCGVRPFGRRWAMMRLDGVRGGFCTIDKVAEEKNRQENIRRLERLEKWMNYFEIKSHIPNVIEWAHQLEDKMAYFKADANGNSIRVSTSKEPIDIKLVFE